MTEFNPITTNEKPKGEKFKQRLWAMFQTIAFRLTPFFANKLRVHIVRMWGGKGVSLQSGLCRRARIDYPWNFTIGDRSSIGDNAWVYAIDHITIGKKCCIGEDVRLITGSHDISSPHFHLQTKPIIIKNNVWIATGATILPGVTIGEGAIVGACSVVTKDIPAWIIVAGNPAKEIKKRILREELS